MAGTSVKTMVDKFGYVNIKGKGVDTSIEGDEPRMQYLAVMVTKEGSETHKDIEAQVMKEWEEYKKRSSAKGAPAKNKHGIPMTGIAPEMIPDPEGTIDPDTEEVKLVPSGNVKITFRTNVAWPDGNPQVIKLKDHKGNDITTAYNNVNWSIGKESVGRIFGTAVGNDTGGSHKVTLYLKGIQLAKLVKYEGEDIDADAIDGEDIDLGEEVEAISAEADNAENSPKL